jgi:hypothetical protein
LKISGKITLFISFAPILLLPISVQADTINLVYTDAFSNSADLTLTATPLGNGVYNVTDVTGTWDGNNVAGPNSGTLFGSTSNNFYEDPSVLPVNTIDSGFVFTTAISIVEFYAYNFGGPGYATALTDQNGNNEQSGAAFVSSANVTSAPEPGSLSLFGLGFIGIVMALKRKMIGAPRGNSLT